MTNRNPAVVRAEKLRAIMAMPEYSELIGAWLIEAETEALHSLTAAVEPHEVHRAQGGWSTLKAFKERFDQIFAREQSAIAKLQKKGNAL